MITGAWCTCGYQLDVRPGRAGIRRGTGRGGFGFGTSPPAPPGVRRTIDTVLELETDGDDKEGVGVVFGRPRMKERAVGLP